MLCSIFWRRNDENMCKDALAMKDIPEIDVLNFGYTLYMKVILKISNLNNASWILYRIAYDKVLKLAYMFPIRPTASNSIQRNFVNFRNVPNIIIHFFLVPSIDCIYYCLHGHCVFSFNLVLPFQAYWNLVCSK